MLYIRQFFFHKTKSYFIKVAEIHFRQFIQLKFLESLKVNNIHIYLLINFSSNKHQIDKDYFESLYYF